MADPTDIQQQFQQFKQATSLREEAKDHLTRIKDLQDQRWDRLRRVISEAAQQYTSMRIDMVEESLRDKGAPLWLSCVLVVGVTLIPVSLMTGNFLLALTKTTQNLVTRSDRALMLSAEKVLERRVLDSAQVMAAAANWLRLGDEIKRTEGLVAKFVKNLEPEVANTMQDVAHGLAQFLGKHLFVQSGDSAANKLAQNTDAPPVAVTSSLNDWIDIQIKAEEKARDMLRNRMRDLFDIATSPDPAKEARAKEADARKKEAARESRVPFRRPVEELPKKSKDAMDQLKQLRDQAVPTAIEIATIPNPKDLKDLQLLIESMIWVTTYDFTPKIIEPSFNYLSAHVSSPEAGRWKIEAAPLPDTLWKRLISRYIDPDEGKSYKDVADLDRLGTKDHPVIPKEIQHSWEWNGPRKWSPEVRLSHYFSKVLYPKINDENSEIVQKFNALKVR
jgi:hypothetical protein